MATVKTTSTYQVSFETASTDVWNPAQPINGNCVTKLTRFTPALKGRILSLIKDEGEMPAISSSTNQATDLKLFNTVVQYLDRMWR